MKYLASDVVSRLETMLETLIPVKTGLQIITGCLKKLIRNWSIDISGLTYGSPSPAYEVCCSLELSPFCQ